MDSLQIPDNSYAGPSRHHGASRPVSVSVQPSTVSTSQSTSRRQRASHQVVSSQQQLQQQAEDQPAYRDVYSHPAAVAYNAAHPRRTIPKFGPYLLLQTVGEGEFGKVKLGLHSQWGEEVAVKLIRRGNIDTSVRMSKVEREIEVLRTLKHPNIVRLYDVIETDKYIGIILEYASGGELFDHILAHRYLKEKDAAKLFSQLISGVWYIHQKKIVHRDLKLENLLLDRHRNVIITDFGFANRFEHRPDDLMQTSCGSPCYAAPELVISEGLYVGSAVDIWSCGVILYAMLAGYLPFDDDPANPDGDNINLLYKYIVNTPLSFPDYVSTEARNLLSMMLVPDPTRRADLRSIMAHPWLSAYSYQFQKTVDDLEHVAMEQHQQRRLAYQRQMRQAAAAATAKDSAKVSRTQSARVEGILNSASTSGSPPRSHSYRDQPSGQPELIYDSSVDQSIYSSSSPANPVPTSRKGAVSAIVMPTTVQSSNDDPFALSSHAVHTPVTISKADNTSSAGRSSREGSSQGAPSSRNGPPPSALPQPDATKKKATIDRHTIQVEYTDQTPELAPNFSQSITKKGSAGTSDRIFSAQNISSPAKEKPSRDSSFSTNPRPLPAPPATSTPSRSQAPQHSSSTLRAAQNRTPTVSVSPASPSMSTEEKSFQSVKTGNGTNSSGSGSSRHRKGLSIDKFGLGKIFGTNSEQAATNGSTSRVPSESSAAGASFIVEERRGSAQNSVSDVPVSQSKSSLLSPGGSNSITDAESSKKNRRNTLTVMVEPFSRSIKSRSKKTPTGETPVKENDKSVPPSAIASPQKQTAVFPTLGKMQDELHSGMDMAASTTKARNVMQWFRRKSTAKALPDDSAEMSASRRSDYPSPTPGSRVDTRNAGSPRSPATQDVSFSFSKAGRIFSSSSPPKDVLRIHHGAVDQTTITTRPPPEVIKHVCQVLEGMGIELKQESEYKYRCVRTKRKKSGAIGLGFSGSGNGLAAFTMVGSAASNGVDKRGLPVPSNSSSAGGMLKGLLMRRQSSQVSGVAPSQASMDDDNGGMTSSPVDSSPSGTHETVYGDTSQDAGDEVRFSIELTRIDRLKDTYSLDIRRLKGNLRSYKFLYDTIREYVAPRSLSFGVSLISITGVPIYNDNLRAGTLKSSTRIHAHYSLPIPYSCCNLSRSASILHVPCLMVLASLSGLVFIPLVFIAIIAPWFLRKVSSSHLLSIHSTS
ncbi:Pkinase-domain-containing protein [Suillus paluster]|uniref:Pkinase-domain-containing protein n=1 Tax=Suillus paluster TaxID=48578 RepID=UPI001B86F1A4|nr:Pkinase-domain-containing protein [Suillus paluster]KAG1750401.1 Pkinase-domain-containing protein [Suillus paluster]